MKHLLAAAAFVVAVCGTAHAADVKNIDLGKQATVWFVEDHTVPIVSVNISLPAGASYDPGARPGLASFAASLMDEGAGTMDATAFHRALAAKAIQFAAHAERDYTVISLTMQSADAAEALRLLQLALTRPRFDNEAVARVRTQIVQALAQESAEPGPVAAKSFMRAFFNGHAYGHAADGDLQSIGAITPADLKAFARTHWVKNGLKIAMAGDISQEAAAKLLGQTFAPLSDTLPPPPPNVGRLGAPGVHVVPMAVPQPNAVFGLPGVMRNDPDFMAAYVANYILGGGGFSSRLMNEVRGKRGLTYGISTSINSMRKASVWVGQVATRADAINQTLDVVRQTMSDFAANGPTQAELNDAKTFLTGSFPLAFDSNAGIAAQLGTYQRQGLDAGYVARRNALVQAVTLADVKRVAKRLFDPARLTVIVAGSPAGGPAPQRPKPPVRPAATTPPPLAQGTTPPATAPKPPATANPAAKTVDKPVAKPVQKPQP
jgi:zinc protease